MGTPATIEEILEARQELIRKAAKASVAPVAKHVATVSDGGPTSRKQKEKSNKPDKPSQGQQMCTVNAPRNNGKALSILCWNVQTFTEGKAETNAVVSFIVRQMLDALDTDLCIMLETRENPAVNLAAVESSTELPERSSEDDTGEGDEADEPEELKARVEDLSSEPIEFLTLASEQTGKRFTPPHRIYPYVPKAKPRWSSRRFVKSYAGDNWKTRYEELCTYYAIFGANDKPRSAVEEIDPDEAFELRLRRCATCKQHLGSSSTCKDCRDQSNPGDNEALDRLRQSLEDMTYGFAGRVEHETYAVLVRPSSVEWMLPDTTYLPGKDAQVKPYDCGLLSKRVDDRSLGFQDKSSSFYGRCPFLVQLKVKPLGAAERVPLSLAAFHAPFGASNQDGFLARKDAVLEVLDAKVNEKRFGDLDHAVLLGDLNLDATASDRTHQGKAFRKAVDGLKKSGFRQGIEQTKSSLTTVYNVKRKKSGGKRPNKYEGATWIEDTQDSKHTANFTSSAYDNVFVKGDDLTWRASVVDVIAWLADNIDDDDLTPIHDLSRKEFPDFDSLTAIQKAFFIYRAYVSDHLPIVLDIAVEPSDDGERKKNLESFKLNREQSSQTSADLEIAFTDVLFADVLPCTRYFFHDLEDHGYFAIGELHGVGKKTPAFVEADGEECELAIRLLTARQLEKQGNDESSSSDDDDSSDEHSEEATLFAAKLRDCAWANGWWVAAYIWTNKDTGQKDTLLQRLEPKALNKAIRAVITTPNTSPNQQALMFGRITAVDREQMHVTVAETSLSVPLEKLPACMKRRIKENAHVVLVVEGYRFQKKEARQ